MIERHTQYLEDLRIRHAAELGALARALAGRRPGLLRSLRKNYRTIEAETARIFELLNRREGSHEGSEERA